MVSFAMEVRTLGGLWGSYLWLTARLLRFSKQCLLQSQLSGFPELIMIAVTVQQTAKRASRKGPRQITSKSVKNILRHFSTFFAQDKNVQNHQKYFSTLFDHFRAAPIFRPLSGGSELCHHAIACFRERLCISACKARLHVLRGQKHTALLLWHPAKKNMAKSASGLPCAKL